MIASAVGLLGPRTLCLMDRPLLLRRESNTLCFWPAFFPTCIIRVDHVEGTLIWSCIDPLLLAPRRSVLAGALWMRFAVLTRSSTVLRDFLAIRQFHSQCSKLPWCFDIEIHSDGWQNVAMICHPPRVSSILGGEALGVHVYAGEDGGTSPPRVTSSHMLRRFDVVEWHDVWNIRAYRQHVMVFTK
jgi:hypothetical protein